jgi:tRNA (guanine37-N1)-methyltransferase
MTKLLREMLQGILSREEIEGLAGGFDLIGDIAIVKLPEDMDPEKRKMVGDMLIKRIPRLKSVWNQISPFEGTYRLRKVEHIAGKEDSLTEYREHGIRLFVDIRKSYFSPRLSEERLRVAKLVNEGEKIFNMFSGVGSYSILIAKRVEHVKIFSSEINEDAYRLMVKNIDVNKVKDKVYPLLGDCREHARNFDFRFDRIIMSLPEEAASYLPTASKAIRNGGTIHFYSMVRGDRKKVISEEFQRIKERYKEFELENARIVTEAGPRVYEVALDLVWRSS